jgi:hypothetical protein
LVAYKGCPRSELQLAQFRDDVGYSPRTRDDSADGQLVALAANAVEGLKLKDTIGKLDLAHVWYRSGKDGLCRATLLRLMLGPRAFERR